MQIGVGTKMSEEILERLRKGIVTYDEEATKKAAKEVVERDLSPLEAIGVLTDTVKELGERFARQEIFLPELMMAADSMKAGMAVLEPELLRRKEKAPQVGTIIIGTVKGDIHDIGKAMVSTMLTAAGFAVIDVGKDVAASAFIEAAERNSADIVGASAIMTTTMPMLGDLVEYFKAAGVREKYKMIVGGGPVTQKYAEEIGSDGYGADGVEATDVARKLVAK